MKYSYKAGFRLIKGKTAEEKLQNFSSLVWVLLDFFIHCDQTLV